MYNAIRNVRQHNADKLPHRVRPAEKHRLLALVQTIRDKLHHRRANVNKALLVHSNRATLAQVELRECNKQVSELRAVAVAAKEVLAYNKDEPLLAASNLRP